MPTLLLFLLFQDYSKMTQIIQTIKQKNDVYSQHISQINYNNNDVINIYYLPNTNEVIVDNGNIIIALHSPDILYLTYRDVIHYLGYQNHTINISWIENDIDINLLETPIAYSPHNRFSLFP